ncbi:MAG: hypothetical protein ABL895_12660 [Cyclobacteriaceae bacterium]
MSVKFPSEIDFMLVSWKTILKKFGGEKEQNCLVLIFQNVGKQVILRKDLPANIMIKLYNVGAINMVITETNCKYNKVEYSIVNDEVGFSFDFIESKKYVKISILYAGIVNEVRVWGKVIGGDEFDHRIEANAKWHQYFVGKKENDARVFVFPLISVSVFLIQLEIFKRMFHLNYQEIYSELLKFNRLSVFIIFLIFVIVLISISFGSSIKNLFLPFAVFVRKEKNWYKK